MFSNNLGMSRIPESRAPRAQASAPAAAPGRDYDAGAFFTDAGTLDPLDDMLAPGALPEWVQECLVTVSGRIEDLIAQIDGSAAEADSAEDDWHRAKTDFANAEQAELSADQIKRLRAKVEKALQRRSDASKRHQRLIAERDTYRNLLASARRYLESKRTYAPDGAKQFAVDIVEVDLDIH